MSEEKYCDFHSDTPTRLSCSSCGKSICPKCMVSAAVGFKCPDCAKANRSHVEVITPKQYAIGILSGLVIGCGVGYMWFELSKFGAFISLAISYCVGFSIAKAITASIGMKVGFRIKLIAALITIFSLLYNPIVLVFKYPGISYDWFIIAMTLGCTGCIIKVLAVVISVWAAVRHFRF